MKQLPIIAIIASLLFALNSFSQSNLQIGATGIFSKTKGVGVEIVDNIRAVKNLSIGFGTRPIKFERHSKLYIPVFGTIKYYYPLPKLQLFTSLDPGYGLYPSEYLPYISDNFYRKGAMYLSANVGIKGTSKLAPYASIHFTKFGFAEHFGSSGQYRPISTFNISTGIMLNRPATANAYSQIKTSVALQTQDDYYKRSKRQKKIGRIFLGTGIALIASSIIIAASSHDTSGELEGIKKAAALVVIGGPGIISSLVSIPFFISSAHNQKKMINP